LLQGTRTEGFHAAARRHLKLSGVPVEDLEGEWGKGQHELNVRYAETLEMADRHVVFKQCAEGDRRRDGLSVTFMAKFAATAPARAAISTSACGRTARTPSTAARMHSATSSAAGSRTCPT